MKKALYSGLLLMLVFLAGCNEPVEVGIVATEGSRLSFIDLQNDEMSTVDAIVETKDGETLTLASPVDLTRINKSSSRGNINFQGDIKEIILTPNNEMAFAYSNDSRRFIVMDMSVSKNKKKPIIRARQAQRIGKPENERTSIFDISWDCTIRDMVITPDGKKLIVVTAADSIFHIPGISGWTAGSRAELWDIDYENHDVTFSGRYVDTRPGDWKDGWGGIWDVAVHPNLPVLYTLAGQITDDDLIPNRCKLRMFDLNKTGSMLEPYNEIEFDLGRADECKIAVDPEGELLFVITDAVRPFALDADGYPEMLYPEEDGKLGVGPLGTGVSLTGHTNIHFTAPVIDPDAGEDNSTQNYHIWVNSEGFVLGEASVGGGIAVYNKESLLVNDVDPFLIPITEWLDNLFMSTVQKYGVACSDSADNTCFMVKDLVYLDAGIAKSEYKLLIYGSDTSKTAPNIRHCTMKITERPNGLSAGRFEDAFILTFNDHMRYFEKGSSWAIVNEKTAFKGDDPRVFNTPVTAVKLAVPEYND